MDAVISHTSAIVKRVIGLQNAKNRQEEQLFLAEGWRICTTLIEAGSTCIYLFYTKEAAGQISTLTKIGNKLLVDASTMKKMSSTVSPSGILGVFKIPYQPENRPLTTPGLVLAQVQDPGNMGTLIRTAAAMNVRTVVVVEGCDPWNPKVIQASAGTIGMGHIISLSWQELIQRKGALPLSALVVENGKPMHEVNVHDSLLVIGNEARGIPEEWLKDCTELVTLPMPGGTESLNAAVAGSIALYLGSIQR